MTAEPASAKQQRLSRNAAREARIERLHQQRHRILLGAGLFVCVALSLGAWVWISTGSTAAEVAESELVGLDLRSVLQQLRSGIAQQSVARVVPPALTAARCERELPAVLADHAGQLFLPAVLLAEHFGIASLAPQLRAAMPTPDAETNRVLVRAIERLQPWSDDELSDLLESKAPGVAAGAIAVCSSRPGPPPSKVAAALCASEPEVRTAALEALPATLPGDFGDIIATQLKWMPPEQAAEALMALARFSANETVERLLYDRLSEDGTPCNQALWALARSGRPLARANAVLELALDTSRAIPTRLRAMYCLEQTRTDVAAAPLTQLWPQHPALDYFAARLLILAGQPSGVQLLVRIMESSDEDEQDQHIMAEARVGARQLLAALMDTSAYGDPAIWKEWANTMPTPTLTSLPPPRINLDPAEPAAPR